MRNFKSLELENVVYYKKAALDLDYRGITNIYGRNLDAKVANRSNGAGKSLLVSPIADICVNASPVIVRGNDKKRLFEHGSKVTLSFDNKQVVKYSNRNSIVYQLLEDGVELDPNKSANALEIIREWLPYTEDLYFSLEYLDSRRPSPLHFGTPITRLNFITSLWNLSDFDRMHRVINKKISDLRGDANTLDELRITAERFSSAMEGIDYEDLVSKYKKSKTRTEELQEQIDALYQRISEIGEALQNKRLSDDVKSRCERWGWKRSDVNSRFKTNLETELRQQIDNERKFEKYSDWKNRVKTLRSKLGSKTEEELVKIINDVKSSLSKHKQREAKAQAARREYVTRVKAYKEFRDGVNRLHEVIDDSGLKIPEFTSAHDVKHFQSKVSNLIGEFQFKIEINDKTATTLKDAKGGCPICGTVLSREQIKTLFDKAKEVSRSAALRIKKLYQILKVLEDLDYAVKPGRIDEDDTSANVSKLEDKLDKLTDELHLHKALRELMEEKPDVASTVGDIDELRAKVADAQFIHKYRTIDVPDVSTEEREELQKQLTELQEKQSSLINKIPQLYATIREYKSNFHHRKSVMHKIMELEHVLGDLPAYRLLADAYSQKGVKRIVINRICEAIERNMNRYSSLLFPEQVSFNFNLTATRFDILATRKPLSGKKNRDKVSDVKQLSGSEGRSFNLLTAVSILPLIGSSKRSNLMILDEALANVDEPTKELIYADFFPVLNQVVPHIINVDINDDNIQGARDFYAVKEHGVTRLLSYKDLAHD